MDRDAAQPRGAYQQQQPQQQQQYGQTAQRLPAAATTTAAAPSGPALQQAAQVFDVLHEMSSLLQTGLTRDQLSLCITLCESGVDPEALAAAVKETKREAAAMQLRHK